MNFFLERRTVRKLKVWVGTYIEGFKVRQGAEKKGEVTAHSVCICVYVNMQVCFAEVGKVYVESIREEKEHGNIVLIV